MIPTSWWGKSELSNNACPKGTGMKMKSAIRNTHPVTTPNASGLENTYLNWSIKLKLVKELQKQLFIYK